MVDMDTYLLEDVNRRQVLITHRDGSPEEGFREGRLRESSEFPVHAVTPSNPDFCTQGCFCAMFTSCHAVQINAQTTV